VELDAILGVAGLFGLGELYLGKRLLGAGFLVLSGAFYACLVGATSVPSLAPLWGCLPSMWGLGYCLLTVDICRLTDRIDEEPAR
jgi:hypothetical protein